MFQFFFVTLQPQSERKSNDKGQHHIVVNLEAEKARNTFAETEVLRAVGLWNNLEGRLYYGAFHAVSALLIHDHHTVNRII